MICADAEITVVVAPREKYRAARAVFDALLRAEGPGFRLVWVDEARAPLSLRRWVDAHADQRGIRHLVLDRRSGANECRARGLAAASTPFVLFLDNDAIPGDGAIGSLLDCMHATNASFVAPLYLESDGSVHNAGGKTRIVEAPAGRRFVEEHLIGGRATAARNRLERMRTDSLEMHGVLVRASSLAAAGGLNRELLSSMDCADLSLRLQDRDGGGWLEPAATVTYDSSLPRPADLPLFLARWSRASVEHDIVRFARTWELDVRDARLETHREMLKVRRMRVVRYLRGGVRRALGLDARDRVDDVLERLFDRFTDAATADAGVRSVASAG